MRRAKIQKVRVRTGSAKRGIEMTWTLSQSSRLILTRQHHTMKASWRAKNQTSLFLSARCRTRTRLYFTRVWRGPQDTRCANRLRQPRTTINRSHRRRWTTTTKRRDLVLPRTAATGRINQSLRNDDLCVIVCVRACPLVSCRAGATMSVCICLMCQAIQ